METRPATDAVPKLKRFSPIWALLWIPLAPLVFPLILIPYLGVYAAQELWVKGGFLVWAVWLLYDLDRRSRGLINKNMTRVESAIEARIAAAKGSEPAALILRSFERGYSYRDDAVDFSLFELIDPVLRTTGFRPIALGTALPLPPRHGVALIETSEAAWWDVFREIARDAAVILISPENTPSLQREMGWLAAEGMLGKVVLLMAPEPLEVVYNYSPDGGPVFGPAGSSEARAAGWREVCRIWLEETGLEMPDYDPRGALIVLPEEPSPPRSVPLRAFAKERWIDRVKRDIRGYSAGYGVEFASIWQKAYLDRNWTGPPVSTLWQRLAPAPLTFDRRVWMNPPGENGTVMRNLALYLLVGWGAVLGLLLYESIF